MMIIFKPFVCLNSCKILVVETDIYLALVYLNRIVSVPILSAEFCDYMFQQLGYNDVMKWGKLCAGVIDGGRDACAGDSGGPLTVRRSEDNKWLLVGIISNGIKCGQPYTPGLYTQVSAFVDWINAVIDNDAKYL
ncbi:unnamed protein product [Oppiella nova]|uniref:Peptidase S1 domain-containing protein n=1 Tax=Oppiella nova TaxID=334625 RepID=A0A7R9Q9Q0_9ACAR|nr:unnamed protein product [Oppiella nova]CAG2158296.1 unnamed protein product [Oppiella nova]